MKIKQILAAFLFTALVISCGNKAKDINVSELKTECEAVDAVITVVDEMLELAEAVDSEEGASEEQKKEFKLLYEKTEEIGEYIKESDFSKKAFEKCPNFETGEKKIKKTRKIKKIFLTSGEDVKEAGEKAGKEVCEKLKSGDFTQSDAQKFMEEAKASIDNQEDAAIWFKAYLAKAMDCMK